MSELDAVITLQRLRNEDTYEEWRLGVNVLDALVKAQERIRELEVQVRMLEGAVAVLRCEEEPKQD